MVSAGAENVGKEAWIQSQANRPQAEAGELLQSLQGYMQQPAAQNVQYGYGAMPQQQPPLVTTEVWRTAPQTFSYGNQPSPFHRGTNPPLFIQEPDLSHCSRIFPGQLRSYSHCVFSFLFDLLSESSSTVSFFAPCPLVA